MGEGPGLVRLGGDLVEDQATGLVDADAALDQILGEAALEVQPPGQIVNGRDTVALGLAGAGRDGFGIQGLGLGGLGLAARLSRARLRLGRAGLVVGHGDLLGRCRIGCVVGRGGRGRLVGHRGCSFAGFGVPAMEDAVVVFALGAKARGGISADRHGRDLERGPVDRAPKLAPAVGLGDVEPVDLVADRDGPDVPGLDVAPDRLDVGAFADPHLCDAAAVLDPHRTGHNRADDGVERVDLVHLQERRARVQPVEPDMGGVEAQLLVIGLAEEAGAADAGPGRPDHLDGAAVGIGGVGRKLRRPAHGRQFDHFIHGVSPVGRPAPVWFPRRRWPSDRPPARCRSW